MGKNIDRYSYVCFFVHPSTEVLVTACTTNTRTLSNKDNTARTWPWSPSAYSTSSSIAHPLSSYLGTKPRSSAFPGVSTETVPPTGAGDGGAGSIRAVETVADAWLAGGVAVVLGLLPAAVWVAGLGGGFAGDTSGADATPDGPFDPILVSSSSMTVGSTSASRCSCASRFAARVRV